LPHLHLRKLLEIPQQHHILEAINTVQQDHKRAPHFEALEDQDQLREAQAEGLAVFVAAVRVGAEDGW